MACKGHVPKSNIGIVFGAPIIGVFVDVWGNPVVCINKGNVVAFRLSHAEVARARNAIVFFDDNAKTRIFYNYDEATQWMYSKMKKKCPDVKVNTILNHIIKATDENTPYANWIWTKQYV